MLYDNTANAEEYSEEENKEREFDAQKVRPELKKRKKKVEEARNWIDDYIKTVVYPQIGLKLK